MKYIVLAIAVLVSACSSTPKQPEQQVYYEQPAGAVLSMGPRNYYGGDTNNLTLVYNKFPAQQLQQQNRENERRDWREHHSGQYRREQMPNQHQHTTGSRQAQAPRPQTTPTKQHSHS